MRCEKPRKRNFCQFNFPYFADYAGEFGRIHNCRSTIQKIGVLANPVLTHIRVAS